MLARKINKDGLRACAVDSAPKSSSIPIFEIEVRCGLHNIGVAVGAFVTQTLFKCNSNVLFKSCKLLSFKEVRLKFPRHLSFTNICFIVLYR